VDLSRDDSPDDRPTRKIGLLRHPLDPDQHRTGWRCIALVTAIWQVGVQDTATTTRYDLSSLPRAHLSAQAMRSLSGIENGLRWVLDVAFRDDDNRTHAGRSAENLALIWKLALNLLQTEPT